MFLTYLPFLWHIHDLENILVLIQIVLLSFFLDIFALIYYQMSTDRNESRLNVDNVM